MNKIIVLVLVMTTSQLSWAASPGGSTQCGLGWYVAKRKSLISSTTRAMTDYTLPPSFSMTSGTAGCDRHSIVKVDNVPAAQYANTYIEPLKQELATGSGESVQTLSNLLGCSSAQETILIREVRENYNEWVLQSQDGFEFVSKIESYCGTQS